MSDITRPNPDIAFHMSQMEDKVSNVPENDMPHMIGNSGNGIIGVVIPEAYTNLMTDIHGNTYIYMGASDLMEMILTMAGDAGGFDVEDMKKKMGLIND